MLDTHRGGLNLLSISMEAGCRVKAIIGDPRFLGLVPAEPNLPIIEVPELFSPTRFEENLSNRPAGDTLVLPPFGVRRPVTDSPPAAFSTRHLHESVVVDVLARIESGEKLAALLPRGACVDLGSRDFRKAISSTGNVDWVIEFDNGSRFAPEIHPAFEFSLLVVSKGSTENTTKFIRLSAGTGQGDVERAIRRLAKMSGGRTAEGFVHRGALTPGRVWTFDAYTPELMERKEALGVLGSVIKLGDIATFPPTLNIADLKRRSSLAPAGPRSRFGLVSGKDLLPEGKMWAELEHSVDSGPELQPDDILVRAIAGTPPKLNPLVVKSEMLPLVAANSVLVIRLNAGFDRYDAELVARFLGSAAAQPFVAATGARLHLTRETLAKVRVPMADASLKQALTALTEAREHFEEWQAESDRAIDQLFSFVDISQSRPQLLSLGRRLRQRVKLARTADQLEARIRTTYPHPIAFRWRSVESSSPDSEGYRQVLGAAEIVAAYLAHCALVAAGEANVEFGAVRQLRDTLRTNKGTSMGAWVAIYRELRTCSDFRSIPTEHPFFEFARALPPEGEGDRALKRLSDLRNDLSHERGPQGYALRQAYGEAKRDLLTLLGAVEFLSEYSLRFIERARRDTLAGKITLTCRDLMGDHPLVPSFEIARTPFDAEEGSLYIVDRAGEYHSAAPIPHTKRVPHMPHPLDVLSRQDRRRGRVSVEEHGTWTHDRDG